MFFKLNEKKPIVLSKQPIVLYLGVFRKGLKTVFQMVELSKPKQPIDSWKQPIVCFGTITEKLFCALTKH